MVITYYWPPAGGPGVQRWLKFTKYLPEFGWEPTVYIPENPSYPITDDTLAKDIAPGLNIIKNRIWEPYQLAERISRSNQKFKAGQFDVGKNQSWKAKLSIWVRGNFFIPDARVFWVKPSIKALKKYLEAHHFDAIVTTGPPHSLHLIGLGLKKAFPHIKWVADFRDPWTEISYYRHLKLTTYADRKHHALEKKVFETADITLATSYTDAENFGKKGAIAVCITNGFDETETDLNSKPTDGQKFTLGYIGVLEQLRNPDNLWQALNEILSEHPDFRSDFSLKFVGRVDDKILASFQNTPLAQVVQTLGYLPHSAAIAEMHSSELLLITNFPEAASKGIIPGKIFEYLAAGKQILSFGPDGADVQKILHETGAGEHFRYSEGARLKRHLLELYGLWKEGQPLHREGNIAQFSRRNLTGKLAEIL